VAACSRGLDVRAEGAYPSEVDIGTERETYTIEPLEEPVPRERPESEPEPTPSPEREPSELPA